MGTSSPRCRLLVLSPSSSQLILVAANIEYTWTRSAPASCDFAIAGRRRVARARGSLNIVSPSALKILFYCYMYVKCVLLFVVIEKIVNAHAGKPRTVNAYFYNIIIYDFRTCRNHIELYINFLYNEPKHYHGIHRQ